MADDFITRLVSESSDAAQAQMGTGGLRGLMEGEREGSVVGGEGRREAREDRREGGNFRGREGGEGGWREGKGWKCGKRVPFDIGGKVWNTRLTFCSWQISSQIQSLFC